MLEVAQIERHKFGQMARRAVEIVHVGEYAVQFGVFQVQMQLIVVLV